MPFFIRKPRLLRVPRVPQSVRVGPVRLRKGGGSVTAGPIGYSWRSKPEETMSEALTIVINGVPVTADMGEWRRVRDTIGERVAADHGAWEQERRAAGQVWYALYWRHQTEYVEECFSREEVERVMEWDDQANVGIVNPDGTFEPQRMYKPEDLRHFKAELAKARA